MPFDALPHRPDMDERYPGWREWWLVSCFIERHPHDYPTPGHLQCMAALVDGLGSPWNISTNWDRCNWYYGRGISIVYRHYLATFDSDRLTNLVLAAHKHCCRIEVAPCTPQALRISIWPRTRSGSSMERHPDLSALAERALEIEAKAIS